MSPTSAQYAALERAFEHFNDSLFDGKLPPCLITLRSSNRVQGYYHVGRFVSVAGETVSELGIHPGHFTIQPVEEVLATLVHEMVHHWQHQFGRPTKSNPHNREWANRMAALGLQPTHTGYPDGRETGRSVTDFIVPGGRYLGACRDLLAQGFALPWLDRHIPQSVDASCRRQAKLEALGAGAGLSEPPVAILPEMLGDQKTVFERPPSRPSNRRRYLCPMCDCKAWAAPETEILCGTCMATMDEAEAV